MDMGTPRPHREVRYSGDVVFGLRQGERIALTDSAVGSDGDVWTVVEPATMTQPTILLREVCADPTCRLCAL